MTHDDKEPGARILLRRDTTIDWATDNPVLMEGETGWDTDLRRVKLGDGVTAWNDLPYAADEAAAVAIEQARAEAAEGVLQGNIDAEALLARNADNLDTGTVDDARLTPRLSGLAGLGLTDGQLLQYDAFTDLLIPLNPVGNSELAAAVNESTAATTVTTTGGAGTIVTIPFTSISISDSNGRPVTLEYQAQYLQTVAGVGTAFLIVYETTTSPTIVAFAPSPLPNSAAIPQQQRAWANTMKRIGVVSSTRTFELRSYLFTTAGDDATISIINNPNCPTILRAVAG